MIAEEESMLTFLRVQMATAQDEDIRPIFQKISVCV